MANSDININGGYFQTALIFRQSSQNFEVGGSTMIPFLPSPTAPFTFQTAFVDNSGNSAAYNLVVTWNYYGQRYYLNCYTVQGALIYCLPMIASPDPEPIAVAPAFVDYLLDEYLDPITDEYGDFIYT